MKKLYFSAIFALFSLVTNAQGWPANYGGVMLQGFYWDGFADASWPIMTKRAADFKGYFDLVWLPQSGNCNGTSMGYDDFYWFPGGERYTSSFGDENQLRTLINTFKSNGIGTIADVVINHRKNVSSWVDFPAETYNGVTYQLKSTDICRDDDGGAALTWANANGYSLSANNDTGEGWGGMRDLDHTSANVQNNCKAYTKMLIDDLGYVGFRYDMVKGYSASYTALYNDYAKPQFSVGECWDGTATICNWINGTRLNGTGEPLSAAFDFQFKYVCRNAFNDADMTKLNAANDGNMPLVSTTSRNSYTSKFDTYRYAITFVENHDTEKRPDGSSNGPLEKDIPAANAWMLAHPGTPCVFLKHYLAYPNEIKAMIDVRKAAGIINQCYGYSNVNTNKTCYARSIKVNDNSDARLLVIVGSNTAGYTPAAATWQEVLSGTHYKYFMAKKLEIPFVNKPSGTYTEQFKAKLIAVSATSGAQLVYTTNGSIPTATNGTKVNSGTEITISDDCTLKVGLLKSGAVSGVITREFRFEEPVVWTLPSCATFVSDKIFAYFENDRQWSKVNVWAWGSFGNIYSEWPGESTHVTKVGTNPSTGYDVYRWEYTPTATITADKVTGLIFNNGASKTDDIAFENGGYYNFSSKLAVITASTGISSLDADAQATDGAIYNLAGQRVSKDYKGLVIQNGRKLLKK